MALAQVTWDSIINKHRKIFKKHPLQNHLAQSLVWYVTLSGGPLPNKFKTGVGGGPGFAS